jgi:DNA (cytosine-5)-methyltransferase 1
MDSQLTAVSMFDGISGFPLALARVGFRTVAAVEIDKAAAGVAADHFPDMTMFDDIRKVTGADLLAAGFDPRNGIITAGFPCQDLSLAGRRMGLDGARSGLYFEIVRILDEILELTGVRCRWVVLENVPGLLSSVCPCPGNGACGNGCTDPHSVRGGACGPGRCVEIHGGAMGAVLGELADRGYGYAYRVLDAQHFGVPQRRRRVVIVANSRDWAAPAQVLLEPQGRDGDPAAGEAARARTARVLARSVALAGGPGEVISPLSETNARTPYDAESAAGGQILAGALTSWMGGGRAGVDASDVLANHVFPMQNTIIGRSDTAGPAGPGYGDDDGAMFTLDTTGAHAIAIAPEVAYSLTAGKGADRYDAGDSANLVIGDNSPALMSHVQRNHPDEEAFIAYALRADLGGVGQGHNTNFIVDKERALGNQDGITVTPTDTAPTITAEEGERGDHGLRIVQPVAFGHTDGVGPRARELANTVRSGHNTSGGAIASPSAVRRLTPVECERLQGYPDGWTATSNGKPQADSARYRQLGNSIAVPVFEWVMLGVAECEKNRESGEKE